MSNASPLQLYALNKLKRLNQRPHWTRQDAHEALQQAVAEGAYVPTHRHQPSRASQARNTAPSRD